MRCICPHLRMANMQRLRQLRPRSLHIPKPGLPRIKIIILR